MTPIDWIGIAVPAALAIWVVTWIIRTRDGATRPEHAAPRNFRLAPSRALAIHCRQHLERPRNMAARLRAGETPLEAWQARYAPTGHRAAMEPWTVRRLPPMSRPSMLFERDPLDLLIEMTPIPAEPTPNQRMNLWQPHGDPADTALRRAVLVEWADRMLYCPLPELERVVDADRRHVKALAGAA